MVHDSKEDVKEKDIGNELPRMRDSARYYALALGWAVMPIWAPKFDGCDSDGKLPGQMDWERKASRYPGQVAGLWAWWLGVHGNVPNIGLACGPSGLCVVDIDPKNGGNIMELPLSFEEQQTATVTTGSGGKHLYYKTPAGKRFTNTSGVLAPGVDTRATGGYVVAPPSLHVSGARYLWETEASPKHGVLELPACLVELLEKHASEPSVTTKKIPKKIPRGIRQTTLFSLAGMNRWKGCTEEEIHALLVVVNQRCDPPLPDSEIDSMASSVGRFDQGDGGESQGREDAVTEMLKRVKRGDHHV